MGGRGVGSWPSQGGLATEEDSPKETRETRGQGTRALRAQHSTRSLTWGGGCPTEPSRFSLDYVPQCPQPTREDPGRRMKDRPGFINGKRRRGTHPAASPQVTGQSSRLGSQLLSVGGSGPTGVFSSLRVASTRHQP